MARFWCKTCEIFIDDNKIARSHHDQSQKHKINIQKSINKLHQKNRDEAREQRLRDKELGLKPKNRVVPKKKDLTEKQEKAKVLNQQVEVEAVAPIGEWETVDSSNEPITDTGTIVETSKIISETPLTNALPSTKIQVSASDRETRKWDIKSKKSIQDTLSDDEDAAPKTTIKFKKRRIIK